MKPKIRRKETKEIGFSKFRLWTKTYICVGWWPKSDKSMIECYKLTDGEITGHSYGISYPIRTLDKSTNFQILKT